MMGQLGGEYFLNCCNVAFSPLQAELNKKNRADQAEVCAVKPDVGIRRIRRYCPHVVHRSEYWEHLVLLVI